MGRVISAVREALWHTELVGLLRWVTSRCEYEAKPRCGHNEMFGCQRIGWEVLLSVNGTIRDAAESDRGGAPAF